MITKDSVSLKEFTVELSDLSEELKSLLEKCWAVSESEDIRIIVTRSRECSGHSVQVSVLQEPVLECKTFLLPLAPFLVVKIDVSALFKLIIDHLGLLVPLEPHHVLGVKPPALLLQSLGGQVLRLGALHVVEDEEERLRRKSLEEVDGITALWWCLWVVGRSVTRVPRQVRSQSLRVRGVGQVVRGRLQHAVLELVLLAERNNAQWSHS